MSKLDTLMQKLNKEFKEEIIVLGAQNMAYAEKIPFSSPRLNYMTYGGFPLGKATELIGPEGGGKTTTAIDAVANAQQYALEEWEKKMEPLEQQIEDLVGKDAKQAIKDRTKLQEELEILRITGPRRVVYVDTENTLDTDWAELNGVDVDALWLVRPQDQTAEQVLEMMLEMLRTGEIILMVLDSIPMLVSQKLFDKTLEDKAYGGIADVMAAFSAKVSRVISKAHTALIMINQVRENMQNPFDLWKTPGGRALRHLYALRLGFQKGKFLDSDNKELPNREAEPAGNKVDVTVVKTKVCKPDRRVGYYTLNYTNGIDVVQDTVDVAQKYGIVTASGSWYYIMDPETGEVAQDEQQNTLKFQGNAAILARLREDDDLFEDIYEQIHQKVIKAG